MRPTDRFAICTLWASAAACVPDRPIAKVDEDCLEQMDDAMYHHACQHGRLGPYTMVDAVAVVSMVLPTVDAAQRVLTVKLPPHDLDPDGISYMRYVATRNGQHAVFAGAEGRPVHVDVRQGDRRLPLTPIEPVPSSAMCGGMLDVTGVELVAGEEYVLALGPTDAAELRMFIENLPTFGQEWSDRCVD